MLFMYNIVEIDNNNKPTLKRELQRKQNVTFLHTTFNVNNLTIILYM